MQSLVDAGELLSFTRAPSLDLPAHPITPPSYHNDNQSPFFGADTGQNMSSSPADTISADETIPAIMVGIASSVMICAVFLYITDIRDRHRHERMLEQSQQRRGHDTNSKQLETIASSGYWIPETDYPLNHPYPILPPMDDDDECRDQPDYIEDMSLSPVSTMTLSLALDSLRHIDSEGLEASLEIVELSEDYRVSQDMDIASLVDLSRIQTKVPYRHNEDKDPTINTLEDQIGGGNDDGTYSSFRISIMEDDMDSDMESDEDESGWTSSRSDTSSEMSIGTYLKSIHSSKSHGSTSSSTKSFELLGERCLEKEVTPQKSRSDDTSLDRSPDTPHGDQPFSSPQNELAQLEQLYNKTELPFQEYSGLACSELSEEDSIQDYVRDIFVVPVADTCISIGIEVEDAPSESSYPAVASISEESPLLDRIFVNDLILAINNEEMVGLCATDVMKRFILSESVDMEIRQQNIVKLTVMSSHPDGSDSGSVNSIGCSVDTGRSETALEV